jgi:hypothetical protein
MDSVFHPLSTQKENTHLPAGSDWRLPHVQAIFFGFEEGKSMEGLLIFICRKPAGEGPC